MSLVGQTVKINRGGPDSVEGVLLSVQNNYLAVWSKEGSIVYVSTTHIKSITATGKSGGAQGTMASPISAYNFASLLQALRYRHVQINRGGPEKLEGIVADANQSYLMLAVKGEEVVRIPIYHVKSVSVLVNSSGNSSSGNSSSGNNKNNSGGNKSGGNNSGGNRSGRNQSRGNQSGGNRSGNQTRGNQSGGNQTRGNRTGGNQSWGSRSSNRTGNRTGNRSRNRTGNRSGNRTGNRRRGNRSGRSSGE
ncbi:hypothetical protein [Paenibacillus dendrobii]|nr:hypothetical protein [Paenibacillus dendrobii]